MAGLGTRRDRKQRKEEKDTSSVAVEKSGQVFGKFYRDRGDIEVRGNEKSLRKSDGALESRLGSRGSRAETEKERGMWGKKK